jgi:hypothetical protein
MATKQTTDEATQIRTLTTEISGLKQSMTQAFLARATALGVDKPVDPGPGLETLLAMSKAATDRAVTSDVGLTGDRQDQHAPASQLTVAHDALSHLFSELRSSLVGRFGADVAHAVLPKTTPHDPEQLLSYAAEVSRALSKSADWTVTNKRTQVDLAAFTTDLEAARAALRAAVDAAGTQASAAHHSKTSRDDARTQMHDAHRALLHGAIALLEAGGLTTQARSLADRHPLIRSHKGSSTAPADPTPAPTPTK